MEVLWSLLCGNLIYRWSAYWPLPLLLVVLLSVMLLSEMLPCNFRSHLKNVGASD